jgi:hypothetical protein
MALWILPAVQYTEDFYSLSGNTVKQYMALDGKASDIRQELRALGAHTRLLGQRPELILYVGQITFGLGAPPTVEAVLKNVYKVAFGGGCN